MDKPAFGEIGRLEYDPIEDALLCHVCGGWYHNLAQHVRLRHHMSASDYREYAGLNRQTRLITPTMRERLRDLTAPLIARLRAEGKLRRWDEDPDKWARNKAAAEEVLHQGMSMEARWRRRQSFTEERRQSLAQRRRERNLAGLDRASSEAISEGLRRYYQEHPEAVDRERLKRMAHLPKISERTTRDVVCARCGQTFRAMSHREKHCPSCRPAANRERNTRWRQKWRERKHGEGRGSGALNGYDTLKR